MLQECVQFLTHYKKLVILHAQTYRQLGAPLLTTEQTTTKRYTQNI